MKKKITTALLIIGIGGALIAAGYMINGNSIHDTVRMISDYHNKAIIMEEDQEEYAWSSVDTNETPLPLNSTALRHLNIDVSYVVLKIIPHDKDSFTYTIAHNDGKIGASVQVQGNVLRITTKKHNKRLFNRPGINVRSPKTVITVNIPKNATFDTVDISTGTAIVLLEGFTAIDSFDLNIGVTKANIKNITGSNVTINTGVGETVFKDCTFKDTVMETGIGETTFEGKFLGNLEINTGIGETTLQIEGKKDDYSFNITSGIGSVTVNGSSISGIFGSDLAMHNSAAAHTIYITTGIGAVNIDFTKST